MTVKEKSQALSQQLLAKRYLVTLKDNPEQYIGVELEFPIVNTMGNKTDVLVTKALFKYLQEVDEFKAIKLDDDGKPVQLQHKRNKDQIVFELSYNTIEFAFEKTKTIQEVESRFHHYLGIIQPFLRERQHQIEGSGIHPYWRINDNQPVKINRYKMLIRFLQLSGQEPNNRFHHYPDYGTFICGNQVQLDVSRSNYLEIINAMNKVEPAKAYLFANSIFDGENWNTKISRDIFWEESMHGIYPENVGVNTRLFKDEDDFFDYLDHSAIFTVERDEQTYYFYPIQARDYLATSEIQAYALNGDEIIIYPQEKDFETHRSYQYQDLTTRGTVEFRSVCTQPLDRTFASAAYHLGLLVNLDKLEAYLETAPFFKEFGRNYKFLRRQFSKKNLLAEEKTAIIEFSKDLLLLAEEGLEMRNKQEMIYLQALKEELGL